MNIPQSFDLLGHKITIKSVENLQCDEGKIGSYHPLRHEICLQPSHKGGFISRTEIEQTFFHELVHAILISMGETELNANEKFVDMFAGLLHQSISTQRGTVDF